MSEHLNHARKPRYPVELHAEAVRLRQTGATLREIAATLGVGRAAVNNWTRGIKRGPRLAPRKPCSSPYPAVQKLYHLMKDEKLHVSDLAIRAGYARNTLYGMFRDRFNPRLAVVEDCFAALGYELVPKRKTDA